MDDREREIRDEAYRLWDAAGRPDDGADAHWYEAERLVDERAAEEPTTPKTVVKNAGNSGVQTVVAAPLKGDAVEVSVGKSKRSGAKPAAKPAAKSGAEPRPKPAS